MTSAGPSAARISRAVDSSKNDLRTRTPLAAATSATPPDGSTPRCRTPASAMVASMTPSLQPISTTNGSSPVSSSASRRLASDSKWARMTDDPEEKYGYPLWNMCSRGTSSISWTIVHVSHSPAASRKKNSWPRSASGSGNASDSGWRPKSKNSVTVPPHTRHSEVVDIGNSWRERVRSDGNGHRRLLDLFHQGRLLQRPVVFLPKVATGEHGVDEGFDDVGEL